MEAIAAALIPAVVGLLGGYILGNLRLKYEHLHERRAGVIARMCELLAAVQKGVAGFTYFLQRGDVDRHEQAQEANRSFFELVDYYHANEVWLEPETCKKIETFMDNVYVPLVDYFHDLDERGYPQTQEGAELGLRIVRETQPLRRELISEFRRILYPPPWYDYPQRFLEWLQTRNRKDTSGEWPIPLTRKPARVPKILRKLERNNLCPLATISRHECGQRVVNLRPETPLCPTPSP